MLFIARYDSAEVLGAIEEALDTIALAVEREAEAGFAPAMDHRGDVRCGAGCLEPSAQPIGIPDSGLAPPHEAVVGSRTRPIDARQRPPRSAFVCNTQKIPFKSRRSSIQAKPRSLFGSSGSITRDSKTVSSYYTWQAPIVWKLEAHLRRFRNPISGFMT